MAFMISNSFSAHNRELKTEDIDGAVYHVTLELDQAAARKIAATRQAEGFHASVVFVARAGALVGKLEGKDVAPCESVGLLQVSGIVHLP